MQQIKRSEVVLVFKLIANVPSHRIPLASGIRACLAGEMPEVPKARDSVDWLVELSRCAAG